MSEPLANSKKEGMHFSRRRSPTKWFSDPNFHAPILIQFCNFDASICVPIDGILVGFLDRCRRFGGFFLYGVDGNRRDTSGSARRRSLFFGIERWREISIRHLVHSR